MKLTGSKKCACGKTISANALYCRTCTATAAPRQTEGVLEILNVQGGDVKITFDQQNVSETIRAKRIVTDMLRRGYALVVEVERDGVKAYERVQSFDEARGEYIISDFDPMSAHESDMDEAADRLGRAREQQEKLANLERATEANSVAEPDDISEPAPEAETQKRGRRSTRLPMESTKATGIGRSAGG